MDFGGKNIIVTGGASGIGKAITEGVVEGNGHAIIVDINMEMAEGIRERLGEKNVSCYKVNLADQQETRKVFTQILADFGHIHGLANNAGIVSTVPFEEVTQAEWDKVVAVNLTSVYATISVLFPSMKANGYGRIVNVASVAAKRGGGLLGTSAYAASKAGVIGLTKAIAREGALFGVACNGVCPSYTITPMTSILSEEKKELVLNAIPMHRGANPEEIANVILFYLSDLSSFVTGEISDVDGGVTMDG
ncbi:3-oxoacyl-[acyl-carrier-protein] reductase FabG [Anaerotignum neopropionicum]|uniref:3-oxoacyl-[acyl-carrier-protein] reductase FabG n=1 Tax=Anaerotignum neopropionicum TaxID=36847 RepID=A0A136WG36_9FIRM|nr:SDR family NAD(P)-dependent oxidoreductase [Anaerotignum neopropionicum]KXL53465.1 3-oxoacyl-[acyl-carrier-protein] reductase FabG [Anaerotignum neopropionicum]